MLEMLNLFNIRLAFEVKRLLIACNLLFYDPFKLVFIVAHYVFSCIGGIGLWFNPEINKIAHFFRKSNQINNIFAINAKNTTSYFRYTITSFLWIHLDKFFSLPSLYKQLIFIIPVLVNNIYQKALYCDSSSIEFSPPILWFSLDPS